MEKKEKGKSEEIKPKKKGKKIILLIVPLMIGLVGGAYFFLFASPSPKARASTLPPLSINFGSVTTNLSDGHIVQAQLDLSVAASPLASASVAAAKSEMTDTVIQAFAGWSYQSLLSPGGRNQFKAQLISSLNTVLASEPGKPKITTIYFTNFIMQ